MSKETVNVAEQFRYPTWLVDRYGAKAGLLLYVAGRLPDIPQSPMVVNEPGEDIDQFVARADKADIGWPRFFRRCNFVLHMI